MSLVYDHEDWNESLRVYTHLFFYLEFKRSFMICPTL